MSCDWFAREGATLVEQGELAPAHVETCAECRRELEDYLWIAGLVKDSRDEVPMAEAAPAPGWQAQVLGTIDRRRRRRIVVRTSAALALAAAIVLAVGPWLRPAPPDSAGLRAEVQAEGPRVRADGANAGDRWILEGSVAGAASAELRVYLGDRQLLMRCSDAPPCQRSGDRLRAELVLPGPGHYAAVLLLTPRPMTGEDASFDEAAGRALESGGSAHVRELDVY